MKKEPINQVRRIFANYRITSLNRHTGANIHTGKGIVTVWFKKLKFSVNGEWHQAESLEHLFDWMVSIINPKPKVAPAVLNEPKNETNRTRRNMHSQLIYGGQLEPYQPPRKTNGVHQCIQHITNKIATVEKNNPNNAVLTVLKQLTKELQQFL